MLLELLSITLPVFLCAGVGYAWARSGRPFDAELMTALISGIGAPCLVFSQLVSVQVDPSAMLRMGGAAALALLVCGAIAWPLLRAASLPAHTFLGPVVFPNAGNMGIAVCLFAFGAEGLALAVCFYTVSAIAQFTVGIWVWTGRISFRELLRTPLAYAGVLASAAIAARLTPPLWAMRTIELLGDFTIPLMLLSLGASLAGLTVRSPVRTAILSLLRLGLGAAVGVLLAELLGFSGVARGVLILEAAMPVAVFNYLLSQRYGRAPGEVASLVLVSTVVSFATLPLLLAWLL